MVVNDHLFIVLKINKKDMVELHHLVVEHMLVLYAKKLKNGCTSSAYNIGMLLDDIAAGKYGTAAGYIGKEKIKRIFIFGVNGMD